MNLIRILLICLLPVLLSGQPIIGNKMIPKKGDTLKYQVDNMANIDLGTPGTDKFWNFTNLNSGVVNATVLTDYIPQLLRRDFEYDFYTEEDKIIRFYRRSKSKNKLYEVAIQRPHPLNSNYICFSKYEKNKTVRYADMKYGDDLTDRASIHYTLPKADIPDIVRKKLPFVPDSIRIKVEEIQDMKNDAWGTVSLGHNSYEVLRQDLYTTIITTAEIYSAGKWSEIDNSILDPLEVLLGRRNERFFIFYSDRSKEYILKAQVNPSEDPIYVEYKADHQSSQYVSSSKKKEYILSPNPTFGDVKLEMLNADHGKYTFSIYNIIGKKLWENDIIVDRKLTSYKFNFSFLGKGTYLWAINNSQGTRLSTKRLIIITP